MTAWIYAYIRKQVGDAANRWFYRARSGRRGV
jgi:hypothetical protein